MKEVYIPFDKLPKEMLLLILGFIPDLQKSNSPLYNSKKKSHTINLSFIHDL